MRVGEHRRLIHDPIVGHRDLLDVLLRRGVARDDGIVNPIHAQGDGPASLNVGFFQQEHGALR